MTCKLVLIEGLPGAGKSTHAGWADEILAGMGLETKLFLEGNLEHPADYDGVACFTEEEYRHLLSEYSTFAPAFEQNSVRRGSHFFLPYRKLREIDGMDFPEELANLVFRNDIYELPFEQNAEWIVQKWIEFAQMAERQQAIYIFECCFIQNPLTVGLVKHNVPKEAIFRYVRRLEQAVQNLNPVVIYVDQEDVERTFRKALEERPQSWSEGFIEYYTGQGYGKSRGLTGVDGTIEVLRCKRELALEIVGTLQSVNTVLNNTAYDQVKGKKELAEFLSSSVVPQNFCEIDSLMKRHSFMDILQPFDPILVGTFPIDIQVKGSDLDIICEVHDFESFEDLVQRSFGHMDGFTLVRREVGGIERCKVNFQCEGWPVELFAQPVPTRSQNGYRHMMVEARLLKLFGESFKRSVIELKQNGVKTEPAFARLLRLDDDPYVQLLDLESWTDEALLNLLKEARD